MIRYLGPDEDIMKLGRDELRPGQIILNLVGKDWMEYGNAMIVANNDASLRIWQAEKDIDDDFRLTGRPKPPIHPSLAHPPSFYHLSRNDLFICDTAKEANVVIDASPPHGGRRSMSRRKSMAASLHTTGGWPGTRSTASSMSVAHRARRLRRSMPRSPTASTGIPRITKIPA